MRILALAVAANLGILAFNPAYAQTELILGLSIPKSGPFVSLSVSNEIAVDIAVDEINSSGGVNGKKLRVEKFDTAGNPKLAQVSVSTLAEDKKALAIIGPFSSGEIRVAFPAGERLGIVQTSMASSAPGLAKDYKFGFRNTTDEGKIVNAVIDNLRSRKVPMGSAGIAYAADDAVSKAIGTAIFPSLLAKYSVPVTTTVDFQLAAFDLSPQVSQLKKNPPDIIGIGTPPEAAIKLAKELRRQGVNSKLFASSTISDPDLLKRMEGAGEGLTIGTAFFKDANDAAKRFSAEFGKRAKAAGMARTEPNQFDASSHSIVHLYAEAMRKAKVSGDPAKLAGERDAIRKELVALKDFPTIEGKISFNEEKDASKPIYILENRRGEWHMLQVAH